MEKTFWDAADALLAAHAVVIDRPKGFAHPRYPQAIYPVDYGYLEGTVTMDGGGIDVWRGTGDTGLDAMLVTADLLKNDTEAKLLVNCTEEEKDAVLRFQNASDFMKAMLIRRAEQG